MATSNSSRTSSAHFSTMIQSVMNLSVLFFVVVYLASLHVEFAESYTPVSWGCDERSCYPATGNLLVGRQDKLQVSSTCGDRRKERYCILSHLDPTQRNQKCFWCDSTPEGLRNNPRTSHRIENIVYRFEPPDQPSSNQYLTWWQAKNGDENVTIQLDLEAEFHVTHLIITFKTFRPKAMYIEKSYDWGQTWRPHRYFAHDCSKSFPEVRQGAPQSLNETVCQSRYSRIVPSTMGTVIYRVLPPNININSEGFYPYSKEVQDLLKTTNLRIRMTQLHTMGDENLETNKRDIKEKYYYAIYDMTVRGSCSCYGHAERCLPEKEEHKNIEGMVHGKCDCNHNTMGNNCEYCKPDHNDLPWTPALGKKKNECKKCNCNDHAESCEYNAALYAATGNVSGGICLNCLHNTDGIHCQDCLIGFYADPNLEINDPEICKLCDCEPDGTIDDGICDQKTDEDDGMVAGKCHCKNHVGGKRCDRCENGYWNFTLENPDGCQACTCDIRGIVSNEGCNQVTGDCTCKRNVIGRDCNQCRDQHFGLSKVEPNGCKPCDCDVGGSYDNDCDVITGQCKCRPNVGGRRCDDVKDGFFTGPLDYWLFEGELAMGSDKPPTTVIRREPNKPPEKTTWTGPGFMQVYEGSTLTFDIPPIFKDLEYDPVIRYEHLPKFQNPWEKTRVELIHVDGPPEGKCADREDSQVCGGEACEPVQPEFRMPSDTLHAVVDPPLCLEKGKHYQIKFHFDRYDPAKPNPKASILVDSLALLPKIESMDVFDGDDEESDKGFDRPATLIRNAYEENDCKSYFVGAAMKDEVPEECNEALKSISMYAFEGGFAKKCDCDNTGSGSSLCDKYTGQCPCKKNVVGRKCSRCAPAFYGFGTEGCLPCNCHNIGALDPFCDQIDGQCTCDEKAYGRRCDECQPGFWNFPKCQPCECNGHADTCHPNTGECLDCAAATAGFHCEICEDGYYGDPRFGVSIPCRECPCPNTKASGHSFADKCYLDTSTNEPVCECEPEYSGPRCSVCADNFYGNPEIPGGSCVSCNCSENWNFNDTENCDPFSGKCLKCLFHTEGEHCEYCQKGFWGDAVNDMCRECVCNLLGTDMDKFDCDRFTGECNCLPNVEGRECDRCVENHWKIASGEGCEACACDPVGSVSPTCNVFTGQCECRDGFGGRKCDQCKEHYYGDPKADSCYPCNCNEQGSQSFQCDHVTGKCICLEGIGGEKCDQCDRGFVQEAELTADHPVLNRTIPNGALPMCSPCGECFTNWDRILHQLKNDTETQVARAERVKVTGATGAYTRGFEKMESELREVKEILNSASVSNDEVLAVQGDIDRLSGMLGETTNKLNLLDNHLTDIKQAILQGQSQLEYLKGDADNLKLNAQDMKDDITALQETNVEGALNLTREANRRSDDAARKVANIQSTGGLLKDSEKQRIATETLMNTSRIPFMKTQEANQETLMKVTDQIQHLESMFPNLNKQVCDAPTSNNQPCDELCGGAGCGKCGGLSCINGSLSKASEAVRVATDADTRLAEKNDKAAMVLRNVMNTQQSAVRASNKAQEAYDMANQALNRSTGETERIALLTDKIDQFTSGDQPTPDDVRRLAEECLAAKMNMDAGNIEELADKINDAINQVANVDQILDDTAGDLEAAQTLNANADRVRQEAQIQLEHAEKVTLDLSQAVESQNDVDAAIQSTQTDIDSARKDLAKIVDEMEKATKDADTSVIDVTDLASRQQLLQTDYIKNKDRVEAAQGAAEKAKAQAEKANSDLYQLNTGFKNISSSLDEKIALIGSAKNIALDLQRRANALSNSASNKLTNLYDIEKEFEQNERRLMELSSELVSLNCEMKIHLDVIEEKSNYYRTCSPPGTWSPQTTCQCTLGSPEPTCTSRRSVEYQDHLW